MALSMSLRRLLPCNPGPPARNLPVVPRPVFIARPCSSRRPPWAFSRGDAHRQGPTIGRLHRKTTGDSPGPERRQCTAQLETCQLNTHRAGRAARPARAADARTAGIDPRPHHAKKIHPLRKKASSPKSSGSSAGIPKPPPPQPRLPDIPGARHPNAAGRHDRNGRNARRARKDPNAATARAAPTARPACASRRSSR